MISTPTIQTLSTKLQTTEQNVRREYVQHLFLSYFYQQPDANHYLFKGGTALRIVFNSPRFSEDLDFSAQISDKNQLKNIILKTIREIEREGIGVKILEFKKTTGGYLASLNFQLGTEVIKILLQYSKRTQQNQSEATTISSNFVPPYSILILERTSLIDEKIQALLARSKPRDFYDLYFLLRSNLITNEQKQLLSKVKDKLASTQINFELELKQFLPKSHWLVIRNFKNNLMREIERFL